jgi:predicted site-specific integrase-resolvase
MDREVEMLRVGQAAAKLGIGPHRLRQLSNEGRVPVVWGPYGRMYRTEDIERFREARERETANGTGQ